VAHRLARHAVSHRTVAQPDLAAVEEIALRDAGDDLGDFGATRADEAEHAGDLASVDRERGVSHDRAHRNVLHAQHLIADRARLLAGVAAVERAGKRTANHGADDLVAIEGLGLIAGYELSVA